MILAGAVGGPAAQESHGVGMARIAEHAGRRSLLHELTGVQDPHAVAQARDHREIVADEEDGVAELGAQVLDEIQHFGLDRGVESRGRLVEDQEPGTHR